MGYGQAAGAKGGRGYIRRAVEHSLRRLRTDYIDLYQIHTPDPQTPIAETLSALSELVTEGKVRYLGNSNFSGWRIARAPPPWRSDWAARPLQFFGAEPSVDAGARGRSWRSCRLVLGTFGLGVLPYFPLANGLLTGKIRRGQPASEGTRLGLPGQLRHRGQGARHRRGAGGVGGRPRRLAAHDRDREPGAAARLRERDRRGHVPGAGERQCRRRAAGLRPTPSWPRSTRSRSGSRPPADRALDPA